MKITGKLGLVIRKNLITQKTATVRKYWTVQGNSKYMPKFVVFVSNNPKAQTLSALLDCYSKSPNTNIVVPLARQLDWSDSRITP